MIDLKTEKPILSIGDVCPDIILPYGETRQMMAGASQGETNPMAAAHANGEMSHCAHQAAEILAGGSVANTAHGIAVLDGTSWFAGKVGNDYFGRFLQGEFEKAGVDTRYLIFDETIPTSMVIVVIDEHKDRFNFAVPRHGASQHLLRKTDLPNSLLDQIGWFHTSGILLRENPAAETILDLMAGCHRRGIPVSLDLNFRIEAVGNREYVERIRQGIEWSNILFGSGEEEMMPITGETTPQAAARSLVGPNRLVVCRSGPRGADLYLPDGSFMHGEAFSVPVADTLGAGDAYNAGFIVAAAEGRPLEEANLWGNAVAGFKIMHLGARNFPDRRQLEKLIKENTA